MAGNSFQHVLSTNASSLPQKYCPQRALTSTSISKLLDTILPSTDTSAMADKNPLQRAAASLSSSPTTHRKLKMRNEVILNCKLYDCDLVDCTIDSCELYTCTIRDAKIYYSKIHHSQVSHSKISDAELYRCHKIEGCEMSDSILVDSVLLRSTFTDDPNSSHLRSLFFRNCRMENCRVQGGRMCRSSFNKGWLRNCKAETTKITGSRVQDSNLLYCEFKTGRVQDTIIREGSLSDSYIIGPEGCREVARAPLAFERFPLEIVQAIFRDAISWEGKRVALIDAVRGHKVFYEEALKALSSVGVFCISRNISCPPVRADSNDNVTRMNWSRVKNLVLE